MKRDLAEKMTALAVGAAAGEGTPAALVNVREVVEAYLTELARCLVCDGKGSITTAHDLQVELAEDRRSMGQQYVPIGTSLSCPRCGGTAHDPEFVAWHCFAEGYGSSCSPNRANSETEAHARCGWHLVLPLIEAEQS